MAAPKRIFNFRVAAVCLFALFYGAYLIAQLGPDSNWIVAWAGTGACGIIVPPSLVLVGILAFRRKWLDLAATVVLSVVFLVITGQLVWHRPSAETMGTSIRVMTFNVEHGWHGIEKVAEVVRSADIDAFGMQELGLGDDRETIAKLKELLPEYRFFSDGSRTSATRLPVLGERSIPLDQGPWGWTMIEQVVEKQGQRVRILNVHAPSYLPSATLKRPFNAWLARWGELASAQTALIRTELTLVEQDPVPTVLCGDLNMGPVGTRYRLLSAVGTDCFLASGHGVGWSSPAGLPLRRIDYLWAFHGLRPTDTFVVDHHASDHAAVVSVLALPTPVN